MCKFICKMHMGFRNGVMIMARIMETIHSIFLSHVSRHYYIAQGQTLST